MYLIYGKGKVGSAVASLCDRLQIPYDIRDDSDSGVDFAQYERIIPSPGIPSHHAVYQTDKVISELDFASEHLPKGFQTIGITGTDGKSTTAWIMYSILEKEYSGKKSIYLSGNFDIPFSATVGEILEKGEKRGIIVLEISSFMAYSLEKFRPDYAIFTNFKPDHLNWHKNLQDYLDSKMHLMRNARKRAIMNRQIIEFAKENNLKINLPENTRLFGLSQTDESYRKIGHRHDLRDKTNGYAITISGRWKYNILDTNFSGMHNAMNILSVGLVASEMKICSKRVKKYFSLITGLPHRLEKIGEKNDIIFVEDSKSTSAQSLEAALGSYGNMKNLLLIVGGSDKGDTFAHLAPMMRDRVKAMACIGATKKQFLTLAKSVGIPSLSSDSLEEAVCWLYDQGEKGDVLMLSPGCASFGLFRDYLDRAIKFRESYNKIPD